MDEKKAPLKLSDLTCEEQVRVLKRLAEKLHFRIKELMIAQEIENGIHDHYGSTLMTHEDRLHNRLIVDIVFSDMGIPPHDTEAREWVQDSIRKE